MASSNETPGQAPEAPLPLADHPARQHQSCRDCGLWRTSKAWCVPGEGNPNARIVLVGEGLGEAEEELQRPFQGRAGWILNRSLFEAGLLRNDLWITNAARCRPLNAAGGNRKPTSDELLHCRGFLDTELAQLPERRVIVALGGSAGWSLLHPHIPSGGVLENQGRAYRSERYQSWVIQTVHPAWALRKPGEAMWLTLDLKKAANIAQTGRPPEPKEPSYTVVHTLDQARAMRDAVLRAPYVVWDWETNGLHLTQARGFCVSFGDRPDHAWVVPRWGQNWGPVWARRELPQVDALLREVFLSRVPKIGHHVAFDYAITLSTLGVRPVNIVGDTMLQHHLLFNHLSERAHGLKRMADMYTAYGRYDDVLDQWLMSNGYIKDGKADGAYIYKAPNETVWKYNAVDSIVPWLLHPLLEKALRQANLWEVYTDERMPLALEYAEMDRHGVPMHRDQLQELSTDLGQAMKAVETEIGRRTRVWRCKDHCGCASCAQDRPKSQAHKQQPVFARCCDKATPNRAKLQPGEEDGLPLNPNSPQQVATYLYDTRGLPIIARTETGQASVKEEALKEYAEVEPLVPMILHYRAYTKLKGTYVDGKSGKAGIMAALDADGYARMSTMLHVVETLRMATRKPLPIHLIPRPLVLWNCAVHGKYRFDECCAQGVKASLNIRGVVRPHSDRDVLVTADYVQQEYALAAIASGQRDLEEAILDRREDAHEYVMGILSGRSRHEFQVQQPDGTWVWRSKQAEDEYKNLRSFFKQVNFMILYRGGAPHLARSLNIEEDEAERQILEYYERLPQIKWWQYHIIKQLRETGRVVGLFNVYRTLPNIWSPFRGDRNEAERQACNFPFQNGGYHVLARGMLRLAQRWRRERFPGRLLFSVHDEAVALVRRDLIAEAKAAMRAEMEHPHPQLVGGCGIPRGILVDCKAVEEWGGKEVVEPTPQRQAA